MELNKQQLEYCNKVTSNRKNYFITGCAGTGKSVLLKELVVKLKTIYTKLGQVQVTALTGIAGINIDGSTLHSFAGFGHDLKRTINSDTIIRWRNTKVLIIDEVSMLNVTFFDLIAPLILKYKIQLVCFGDFFQLPPVEGEPCFKSIYWQKLGLHKNTLVLEKVVRQDSKEFCEVLNQIRVGEITPQAIKYLSKLDISNNTKDLDDYTKLYALNVNVDSENHTKLNQLESQEYVLESQDSITDKNTKKPLPISLVKDDPFLQKIVEKQSPQFIKIKVGAKVMLTRNMQDSPLVNGSQGIVIDIKKWGEFWTPVVKFYSLEQPITIQPIEFETNYKKYKYVRKQIPIKLAWALSIHKSQGLTLDKVLATLYGSFASGQIYTVLSRVRDPENLVIDDIEILQHYNKVCPHVKKIFS